MKQEERKLLKKQIKEKIKKQTLEIAQLEESAQPVSPENAIGRISRMDAINNKGVLEASIRNRKRKLGKLQLALSKINNSDFGICSRCKNPIQPQRVILMPESDKCVNCA